MSFWPTLLNAGVHMLGTTITWREIIGNLLGLLSVIFALQRRTLAWPISMAANVLLFTIFLGAVFHTPQNRDLYGQAGRQVFFFVVSIYGWWRWHQTRRRGNPAVRPRWMTWPERAVLVVSAIVGVVVFDLILSHLHSFDPLADAWIFTGSLLATYGMARGWVEFWLIWIAVDAVGVPLLIQAQYYPSALLYGIYAVFCVIGFLGWYRLQRVPEPAQRPLDGAASV